MFSLSALSSIHTSTLVDGFMSARGALANPALFASPTLPRSCPPAYLRLAEAYGGRYSLHHHHLMFMMASSMSRAERMEFAGVKSLIGIRDWFEQRGWMHQQDAEEEIEEKDKSQSL